MENKKMKNKEDEESTTNTGSALNPIVLEEDIGSTVRSLNDNEPPKTRRIRQSDSLDGEDSKRKRSNNASTSNDNTPAITHHLCSPRNQESFSAQMNSASAPSPPLMRMFWPRFPRNPTSAQFPPFNQQPQSGSTSLPALTHHLCGPRNQESFNTQMNSASAPSPPLMRMFWPRFSRNPPSAQFPPFNKQPQSGSTSLPALEPSQGLGSQQFAPIRPTASRSQRPMINFPTNQRFDSLQPGINQQQQLVVASRTNSFNVVPSSSTMLALFQGLAGSHSLSDINTTASGSLRPIHRPFEFPDVQMGHRYDTRATRPGSQRTIKMGSVYSSSARQVQQAPPPVEEGLSAANTDRNKATTESDEIQDEKENTNTRCNSDQLKEVNFQDGENEAGNLERHGSLGDRDNAEGPSDMLIQRTRSGPSSTSRTKITAGDESEGLIITVEEGLSAANIDRNKETTESEEIQDEKENANTDTSQDGSTRGFSSQ